MAKDIEQELFEAIEADGVNQAEDYRIAETISLLLKAHYNGLMIAAARAGNLDNWKVSEPKDAREAKSGRFSVVEIEYDQRIFQVEVTELD